MISEPEFDDGTPFETAEVLTEEQAPRPRRPGRPWLWALGGAVLASAVWGGGLYAYGRGEETGPDMRGYKPVEDLCKAAELKGLAAALGKRGQDGAGAFLNEPAISESSCFAAFGAVESGENVQVAYTLHKVTDPGPEFAARAQHLGILQKLDGIGEQAFFDDRGEEGGTLRVLDGQAEIEMQLYRQSHEVDGKLIVSERDLSGIEVPMTQDALALLAALRK
ncbi:hypothetical protein OG462_27965 [Streptomyces sp. NBC_01077]|uniref:hypothetical protein n=1 Tax=Streptomyces sp. NBC_01077 TaxID=2903746 RepID=UPI00386B129F|nr:hypothetical protein OG462_27965 [Streptomyces sp. NBC_01077]